MNDKYKLNASWKRGVLRFPCVIRDVMNTLQEGSLQIVVVVDSSDRLLGVVTDGDVRRGLMKGLSLSDSVSDILNSSPATVSVKASQGAIMDVFRRTKVKQLVVIDDDRVVHGIVSLEEILLPPVRTSPVLLMAGGKGRRLLPLTKDCPKPLLCVGDRPLLETIMDGLIREGFCDFFISVNYKKEMIKEHFGDGSSRGVSIRYLEEDEPLGTAGALGLLPDSISQPVIVMNGDVLTGLSVGSLLDYHRNFSPSLTLCVREYEVTVPYGVVESDNGMVSTIREKPSFRYSVNAGIYVVDPGVVSEVQSGAYLDMTDLIQMTLTKGMEIRTFQVEDYWIDIGHLDDYERANREFGD